MKHYKYLLIFLFAASGCSEEITIDFGDFKPEIVVNCMFTGSEYFNVEVIKTWEEGDTTSHIISNAVVTICALKSNENYKLPYVSEGFYADTTFYPIEGERYKIEVNVPGYKTVSAIDSLPALPSINNIVLVRTDINKDSEGYYKVHNINLSLCDPSGEKNFYQLQSYYRNPNKYPDENLFSGSQMSSNEPFIVNEGTEQYVSGEVIFSDEMIDGQTVDFTCNVSCPTIDEVPLLFDVYVVAISQSYYEYQKIFFRYSAATPDVFFPVEPVMMPTNIVNGYGIFAGYSLLKFRLTQSN